MREVNEAVKSTILRSFSAREAEIADAVANSEHSWKWCNGVVLFPEGKCPYCAATIISNRIWKLGRSAGEGVLGRWKVVNGQVVKDDKADHPHVRWPHGGQVCVGHADDLITALFFGMNPGDEFWSRRSEGPSAWNEWLARVWDHLCPRLNRTGRSHAHTSEAVCTLAGCGVRWVNGVAGCSCGCSCNRYDPAGCACGHPTCYCPSLQQCDAETCGVGIAGQSYRCESCDASYCSNCWESGRHYNHGEAIVEDSDDAESDDGDDVWTCSNCGLYEDDYILRSECCPDVCVECHSQGEQDVDPDF